jgi:hypothetical protein
MDADSDVKTGTGVEDVLDSGMEETSCLVAEAEADMEELCATVDDDSCILAEAEAEEPGETGTEEDSWLLADAEADTEDG